MSFLDDIFDWLGDLFTWLWENLSLVLAICAILFIAFAPLMIAVIGPGTAFAAALPSFLSWVPAMVQVAAASWWVAIPAGLGLAYLIDPDTTSSLVSGAANLVVDTASTVTTGVIDAVSTAVTSSSLFIYGVIGLVAYLILSRPDKQPIDNATQQKQRIDLVLSRSDKQPIDNAAQRNRRIDSPQISGVAQ